MADEWVSKIKWDDLNTRSSHRNIWCIYIILLLRPEIGPASGAAQLDFELLSTDLQHSQSEIDVLGTYKIDDKCP
jgi:hypothetical protein